MRGVTVLVLAVAMAAAGQAAAQDLKAVYGQMAARAKADAGYAAQKRRTLGKPEAAMPANRAQLDKLLADKDYAELVETLQKTNTAPEVELNLNWERARIFEGGPMLLPVIYIMDLWRMAEVLPPEQAESVRQTAVAFALYTLALIEVDGLRCADPQAQPFRRQQQLENNKMLWDYARKLSNEDRERAVFVALGSELFTAPVRQNDEELCLGPSTGSLLEMAEGLEALAAAGKSPRPIDRPDALGKSYEIPRAPPKFRPPEQWRGDQDRVRAGLPDLLERWAAGRP